jgi:hypothetical protein
MSRCAPWIALLLAFSPARSTAQKPIGHMKSGDATVRGSVVLSGNTAALMSGAYVQSSQSSATITLERGGDLTLCPNSAITLTSSASGREQLIGVSSGAIETHYSLAQNADTIMTPDFRLQLTGPGDFHFGITLGAAGDVCVQALPSSNAALIVNELLGDGSHQIGPGQRVRFRNGTVANPEISPPVSCGCSAPQAQTRPAPPPTTELGFPELQSKRAAEALAIGQPAPEPPPIAVVPAKNKPGEVQLQIDAPMVFRAEPATPAGPPMPPVVARTSLKTASFPEIPPLAIQAPEHPSPVAGPPAKPKKRNFFRRFGSAIARWFTRRD